MLQLGKVHREVPAELAHRAPLLLGADVLAFIGIKMLLDPHDRAPLWFQIDIPTGVSLLVVAAILAISIALSVTAAHREKKRSWK